MKKLPKEIILKSLEKEDIFGNAFDTDIHDNVQSFFECDFSEDLTQYSCPSEETLRQFIISNKDFKKSYDNYIEEICHEWISGFNGAKENEESIKEEEREMHEQEEMNKVKLKSLSFTEEQKQALENMYGISI